MLSFEFDHLSPRRASAPGEDGSSASGEATSSTVEQLRLQHIALQSAANAIVITDVAGKILWTNAGFTAVTGYKPEEAIGRTPRILKSGRQDASFYHELWRTILAGNTWRADVVNRRRDGTIYHAEQTITPVRSATGAITHFVGVLNDVTGRRQAEAELRRTHEKLRHVLNHSPVVIYSLKIDGEHVVPETVSETITAMLGFPVEETLSYEWWLGQLHADDRSRAVASIAETLERGTSRTEYRLRHQDGTYRWVDDHRRLVRNAGGEPAELIGSWLDVTEHKRAENVMTEAALANAHRLKRGPLFDGAVLTTLLLGIGAAAQHFGWFAKAFDLLDNPVTEIPPESLIGGLLLFSVGLGIFACRRWRESRREAAAHLHTAVALRTLHDQLERQVQQRTVELAVTVKGLRSEIVERERVETALAEERALMRAVIDQIPDLIYVKDRDSRFLLANDAAARVVGIKKVPELIGRTDAEFYAPARAAEFRADELRVLEGHSVIEKEEPLCGDRVFLTTKLPLRDAEGKILGTVGVGREITERKRAENQLHEQREQWRKLVAATTSAVFVIQEDRFVLANAATAGIFGSSVEQLIGRSVLEFFPADQVPLIRSRMQHAQQSEEPLPLREFRIHRADGRIVEIESSSVQFQFEGKSALLVEGRDIGERKRAQETLRESERRFREMLANVELIAMTLDRRGAVTFCNDYLLNLTGWSRAEMLGADWFSKFLPAPHAAVRELFSTSLAAGTIPAHYENPIMTRAGEERDIVWNNTMLRDADGNIIGTASIGEDVTDRKKAAEALQRATAQYQSIFQHAMEGIYQTTPDGKFMAANPAMARILGFANPEELVAQRQDIAQQGYVDPGRRGEFKKLIEARGFVSGFEYEVYRKDGSVIWVSENARVVRQPEGGVRYYEGSMSDVTDRKRAELRLQLQHAVTRVLAEGGSLERTNQQILETVGQALRWPLGEVWTVDRAANVLRCVEMWHPASPEYQPFVTESRSLTLAPGRGLPGRVWALRRADWVGDVSTDVECLRRTAAERIGMRSWIGFPITLRNEIFGVVSFFSPQVHEPDAELVSTLAALGSQIGQFIERQHLAEQFQEAQKMEAIGTLAGGIAHDFNNIIAAITGYTELAKMELGSRTEAVEHLDAVLVGSKRAAALVHQILAFSRQQPQERRPLQLRHIVAEAVNLLRATIPATIEFDFTFGRDLPAVLADATQVHQLVLNLGTNAWQAMKGRPGRLEISLDACELDAGFAAQHPGLRPGPHVRVRVTDTGHGMDRATLSRIFEPFFTTKAPGEGTGLGLAVVHGIMQAHGGAVTVFSQPEQGTTFQLYFPAIKSEIVAPGGDAVAPPHGRGQRLLYIDDEKPLAAMSGMILERLGYVVETCSKPLEALATIRDRPDAFDLVITDLAMPGMSGIQLAQELLLIRPSLPIILVTGYSGDLTPAAVQAVGIREMLAKPLSVPAIAAAAARIFNEGKK